MTNEAKEEIIAFSDDLVGASEELQKAVSGMYGSKAAGARARKKLTEIKKKITQIKKLTMEEK